MSKRSAGILLLLAVVAYLSFGTGFTFFFRFLYVLVLLLCLQVVWAWINLRGIEVQLSRSARRGQVGSYLEGRVSIRNRSRLPKSWLEIVEVTDLPDPSSGQGLALIGKQLRNWRTETYLSRRGVYQVGQVEVTSQDPFGLFRFRHRFLEPQSYTVLPSVEPLPDLDSSLASLPNDGRATKHWDHITTDVASVRPYRHGDSFRRIHWPYTARMNSLMVKEFDMGLSPETWLVLDMEANVHVGMDIDRVINTEELAVTVAASIINRLVQLSIPVGLAASGDPSIFIRPNSSPEHQGMLLEALAVVRAVGSTSLERFLYDLRPSFSRFNTLTVITSTPHTTWVAALNNLRRKGIDVSVVLLDPQGFGDAPSIHPLLDALFAQETPSYLVQRGQPLNEALRVSLTGRTSFLDIDTGSLTRDAVR